MNLIKILDKNPKICVNILKNSIVNKKLTKKVIF